MRAPSAPARIRLRSLPAAAGLSWIRRGFRAFWRRPLGFVGLWLFFTLCLFVIVMAALALTPAFLLGVAAVLPVVTVGFMIATQDMLDDLKLRPSVFWAPFAASAPSRRGTLAIMLIYILAAVVLAACANALDGGEARRWLDAVMQAAHTPPPEGKPPEIPAMSIAAAGTVRFMVLGLTLVSIPMWYAPALVHWGGQGVAQALFSSVVAVWRTRAAFFTYMAGWIVIGIAFDALMQLLAAAFGAQAVSLGALTGQMILSATYFVATWFGFSDTFEIVSPGPFRTVMAGGEPPAQ